MPEAAVPLVEVAGPDAEPGIDPASDAEVREAAVEFCEGLPYRQPPYASRNWGGVLHSLCSYQGKLKPAIAHFLVGWFTSPGDTVLDPMAGVGTVPLEARLQGRVAIAGDLSELAAVVSRAKLESFHRDEVAAVMGDLAAAISTARVRDEDLIAAEHASFGLNGCVEEYFERQTLREILLARRFFRSRVADPSAAEAVVLSSLLHILHGNRPYALSRRSHPVTPFKPSGPSEYRALVPALDRRLDRVLAPLASLPPGSGAHRADFAALPIEEGSVDAVITSPPFAQSLRFFSSNWMRLWLCGWDPDDFKRRPDRFLERKQKGAFEDSYRGFLDAMHSLLRPGGLLVMHLGETRRLNMAERIAPLLGDRFSAIHVGRERVGHTESHGLTDKGATLAHGFLFARAVG
jgi:RMKL-like, methyltransferase domain